MQRTKTTTAKPVVIGYLRVSTVGQDTDKNKAQVYDFANQKGFTPIQWVEEKVSGATSWKSRALAQAIEELRKGDVLIVPELSRLGRSLKDVLDLLEILTSKGVKVYSVKENFQLNGEDMQSKVMRTMIGLFAELERDFIRQRTREGLEAARAKGVQLGRPKGPGKSKLDDHRDTIIEKLRAGVTQRRIAEDLDVTQATLTNWIKRHKIRKQL